MSSAKRVSKSADGAGGAGGGFDTRAAHATQPAFDTRATHATQPAFVRARDTTSEHGQTRDLEYPPLPEALTVGVYDNHTHLEIADGSNPMDYREHLDRASSVGVRGVVQVGGDLVTSRWSAEIAAREPRVLAAVAIHPNEVAGYVASGTLDDALA